MDCIRGVDILFKYFDFNFINKNKIEIEILKT